MKVTVKTESGSIYELDKACMTWTRRRTREYNDEELKYLSDPMRSDSGWLTSWPKIVVGQGLELICPPFLEDGPPRGIFTSAVTEVTKEKQ